MYAMGKGSYRMIGKLLQIEHTPVFRWICDFGKSLPEPQISQDTLQLEFDEMAALLVF